ncbi:hypothetical protein DFS34DRAFT_649765 [Phlyctochytrium arcticum]|nr:hypothetical protein DFS34DRAFT_649765 [Phlyctochytrium arcticum]
MSYKFLPSIRQIVLEDISMFQTCVVTFLVLQRFFNSKQVYFSNERRFGTWLQIFWLVLYFGDNVNVLSRVILDDNPLDNNLKVQNFFVVHAGYAQFLMIIYKTQVIVMTYFRNKRSVSYNENLPDYIFAAITFGLIMTYIRMGRLFATEDLFDMLAAYFQYNVTEGVLAVIALLVSLALVALIVRAEADSPFKNIILNRNMFWQFIGLQILASGFFDVLTFVQFARNKQNSLELWFLATVVVDWPIIFFEWHHKTIFIAASGNRSASNDQGNKLVSEKAAGASQHATKAQKVRSQQYSSNA